MKNSFFRVEFDLDTGRFNVWKKDGSILLSDMTARTGTGRCRRSVAEKEYARCVKISPAENEFGAGQQLIAQCVDSRHELDFEIRIYAADLRETIVVEAFGRNVSQEKLTLGQIELIDAASEEKTQAAFQQGRAGLIPTIALEPGKIASSGKMIFNFATSNENLVSDVEAAAA